MLSIVNSVKCLNNITRTVGTDLQVRKKKNDFKCGDKKKNAHYNFLKLFFAFVIGIGNVNALLEINSEEIFKGADSSIPLRSPIEYPSNFRELTWNGPMFSSIRLIVQLNISILS